MSGQPKPKVALNDICSVIYNNTLYTYSADAFQSLSLTTGSEWKTLTQGESLTGSACVGSTPADESEAAFFVIGGTGGSTGYRGLQKYTYSTGTWESLEPVVTVTENRTNHNAVYLSGSNAIVVYAGSQNGDTNPSTQTFSITASQPYSVLAYESDGAPPTTNPILLRWSDTEAAMVGGSSTNTQVMLFTVGTGWSNSGATLADPLKTGTDAWHAALVTGDDGSKNLYTFDMTVSPNVANRTVLVDGNGAPVTDAVAITRRSEDDEWAQRRTTDSSLTASSWPTYNSTYASTAVRSNSAAAESIDGTVVLSGGSTEDVLCIFNGKSNSWVNATELLEASNQKTLAMTTTSSATSSSTATATSISGSLSATSPAATTAVAVSSSSSSSQSSSTELGVNQILGVVLGSISGAFVMLMLLYCQIKKRKRRNDFIAAGHARRASGVSGEPLEKAGMAVATTSFPRSPTNGTFMRGHQTKDSTGSFSSMAILMGKGPKSSMESPRGPSSGRQSANSNKQFKSRISNPMPAIAGPMPPIPSLALGGREEKGVSFASDTAEPRTALRVPANQQEGTRRSSGWNRYWSGDSQALNILGYGNSGQQTNRNTVESEGSHYSMNGPAIDPRNRVTQDSATVPPLNVDGQPRFSQVNSASPTISNYSAAIRDGMSGQIDHGRSSQGSNLSGYSSGIPSSVQDAWDPTSTSSKPWAGAPRATSSMYSSSNLPMPRIPTEHYPPMPRNTPSGISQGGNPHTSDMSWLNLGEHQQNRP